MPHLKSTKSTNSFFETQFPNENSDNRNDNSSDKNNLNHNSSSTIQSEFTPIKLAKHQSCDFYSTQKDSFYKSNKSLFERISQRKSSRNLAEFTHNTHFERPKIVRALSEHFSDEKLKEIHEFTKKQNQKSNKNSDNTSSHENIEEINRIFKANELKRPINYDLILDNYKAQLNKRNASENQTKNDKPKVYVNGKFIGYARITPQRRLSNIAGNQMDLGPMRKFSAPNIEFQNWQNIM